VLYACKGAHTLFTDLRERKGERERKSENEGEKKQRVRERERNREYLFLKGMMFALAPFSHLVQI
jgi:hypothetical protein